MDVDVNVDMDMEEEDGEEDEYGVAVMVVIVKLLSQIKLSSFKPKNLSNTLTLYTKKPNKLDAPKWL